jgi:hypothetical protein
MSDTLGIEFIGSPGVGKSTVARILHADLAARGWKSRVSDSTDAWVGVAREARGAAPRPRPSPKLALGMLRLLMGMKPHQRLHLRRARRMLGWCRGTDDLLRVGGIDAAVIDQGAFQLVLSIVMHAERSDGAALERVAAMLGGRPGYMYVVCSHPSVDEVLSRFERRQGIGEGGKFVMWREKQGTRDQARALLAEYARNTERVAGVLERVGAPVLRADTSRPAAENATAIAAWADAERARRSGGSPR